jgi:hypothetical protein
MKRNAVMRRLCCLIAPVENFTSSVGVTKAYPIGHSVYRTGHSLCALECTVGAGGA